MQTPKQCAKNAECFLDSCYRSGLFHLEGLVVPAQLHNELRLSAENIPKIAQHKITQDNTVNQELKIDPDVNWPSLTRKKVKKKNNGPLVIAHAGGSQDWHKRRADDRISVMVNVNDML